MYFQKFFELIDYVFTGCVPSSFCSWTFSPCSKQALWLLSSCIVRASHCGGLSSCSSRFWPTGLIVMACVLSRFVECGFFPDPGSNQCFLHCKSWFLTSGPPGKSELWILKTLPLQIAPTIKHTQGHKLINTLQTKLLPLWVQGSDIL